MGLFEDIELLIRRPTKDNFHGYWQTSPIHKATIMIPAVMATAEGAAWINHELNPLGLIDELGQKFGLSNEILANAKTIFEQTKTKHKFTPKALLARTAVYYAAKKAGAKKIDFADVAGAPFLPASVKHTYKSKFVPDFGMISVKSPIGLNYIADVIDESDGVVDTMCLRANFSGDLRDEAHQLFQAVKDSLYHVSPDLRAMAVVYYIAQQNNMVLMPRDLTAGTGWSDSDLKSAYWKLSKKKRFNRVSKPFAVDSPGVPLAPSSTPKIPPKLTPKSVVAAILPGPLAEETDPEGAIDKLCNTLGLNAAIAQEAKTLFHQAKALHFTLKGLRLRVAVYYATRSHGVMLGFGDVAKDSLYSAAGIKKGYWKLLKGLGLPSV